MLRVMTIGKTNRPILTSTRDTHAEIIAALRTRDHIAYAYLMSRHLDFAVQFLPEEGGLDARPPAPN